MAPSYSTVIPVALFAYNRPAHLTKTVQCLRENRVPKIYAFSDGPKTADGRAKVEEVRAILRGIDWCEISIVERPENIGLGRSIRAGVTEVLARHESVIVFEDDLVCVDGTYAYLTEALDRYRDTPNVMSVTGWTHPRITPDDVTDQPYFDGRAECWVWGSWKRAWEAMDEDAMSLVRRCEARGIDPYVYGADLMEMATIEHERNIWAVRFLYRHIVDGGLCLRPPHSLVEHIGADADATNAFDTSAWANPALKPCPPVPSSWPDAVEHPQCRLLAARAYGTKPPRQPMSLRSIVRRATPERAVNAYRRLRRGRSAEAAPASAGYEVLDRAPSDGSLDGWRERAVAERQDATFRPILEDMRAGRPRADFEALAEAIRRIGAHDPLIVDTGCGSGWNAEVLEALLGTSIRYIGADYSFAMTDVGRKQYPGRPFVTGDATALPFGNAICDIAVSSTCLMHVADYRRAIAELRRVSRAWCVFHTVPVLRQRDTIILKKKAYGAWTVEVIFNESSLVDLFAQSGLRVRWVLDSIPYDLCAVVGEKTVTKTYVCEVAA